MTTATPAQTIRKRIRQLEALPRLHAYDRGELANLRESLRLVGGIYGELCQDETACRHLGYCPRQPTCAD